MTNKSASSFQIPELYYSTLFNALSGNNVLVKTDAPKFTILAASTSYIQQSGSTKEAIIGKGIFEAFPGSADPYDTGVNDMRASLNFVIQCKEEHHLPVQRYDVAGENGLYVERYWKASNRPVFSPDGNVAYIIHAADEITDQVKIKHRELQIEGIEKVFKLFMHSSIVVGLLNGDDYVVEMANNEAFKLWGKGPEVINKPIMQVLPQLEGQGIIEIFNRVRSTGQPFEADEIPLTLSAFGKEEKRYFNVVCQPYYDKGVSATGVFIISHDVTELVKTKRKVQESEQKYRTLFECMDQGYCTLQLIFEGEQCVDYRYLETNPTFERHGGISNVIGKTIREIAPDIEPKWFKFYQGVVLTGKPIRIEEESKALNKWFEVYALRIGDAEDRKVAVFFTDITERKMTEEVLRSSERDVRNIALQAPIGICVIDASTLVSQIANRQFVDIVGKPLHEIVGHRYWDTFADTGSNFQEILQKVIRDGVTYNSNEVQVSIFRQGKEETKHVTFVYEPLKDDSGIVYKVAVWVLDNTPQVTARKRIEESEVRFRNMIQQAPVAIMLTRGDDIIIESINASMLQLLNKTTEAEVLGKKMTEVLPELQGQQNLQTVLSVQQTGMSFRGDEQPIELLINGVLVRRYLNVSYTPIIEEGNIAAVLHVAVDVTEQVLSIRKLEENEAKLRTIINSTPTAIGVFAGPDLVVENPNQLLIEIMSAGPDIEGKSFRKLLPGLVENDQKFIDLVDTVRTTGNPFEAQEVEVFFKSDKRSRFFNISFIPLKEKQGSIYAILDVSVDVTEQVLARKKIEESEQRFRLLADASPNLVWMLNSDGSYAYLNKTSVDFLNISQLQVAAEGWAPFNHPDDLEIVNNAIGKALKRHQPFEIEHRLLHKDGDYRWVLSQALPAFDANGKIFAYVGSSIDIDEAKKSKQQLETVLEQVRLSKEAAELGTFDLDLENGHMHWDDRCRILFGISHKEPVTYEVDFIEGLHPEDRERILKVIDHAFIKSISNGDYDVDYRTVGAEDGVIRWVRAKGKVYFNASEKPVRFIGSVLDITEQVATIQKIERLVQERTKELAEANENLLQANVELQRSNDNLEEFTFAASHDLKEPIRKITIFSNQLKQHLLDRLTDNENRIFGRILNATERMGILIDDLLLYSHVTEKPRETELIDLNQKLERVLEDLELSIDEKGAIIKVGRLPEVHGYRRQLQQLFQNLITNALKYSKAGTPPQIDITTKEIVENSKPYLVISFKDNGIGFEQQYADKIFHMFTRLHGNAEYGGTGVGLSIVKKVVENHNGFIKVESTPGVGSTFNIYLPT